MKRLIALVAGVLLLSGCGFKGLYSQDLPGGPDLGDHPYEVVAYFNNVLDLVPQSAVKVDDVPVGKVTSIRLTRAGDDSGETATPGWAARVTMRINGDVRLPADSTAAVKMTSLLGEKYVELQRPSGTGTEQAAARVLRDGSTIPLTRTSTAPEAEQVFQALSLLVNGGGFQEIRTITTELNNALSGNEQSIRDLIGQLTTFASTLNGQRDKITDALTAIDQLATTLSTQTDTLAATLDSFPQAIQVLNDERGQLVGALDSLARLGDVAGQVVSQSGDELVATLRSLQPTLAQLDSVGTTIPNALKIAATYPFPIGKANQAIRGDYMNLHLYIDLNLGDQLCGLNPVLCTPSLTGGG